MNFTGKTAIITGASQGIGFETAKKLAQGGADVVIIGSNSDRLQKAQQEIEQFGHEVICEVCDVSDEAKANEIVKKTLEHFGKVDILVNNAGIYRENRGPFAESQSDTWRRKIDVNIYGTLYYTRAVINSMIERRSGRIINIASVAGTYGIANMADYSLTKGAILAFSKALAREVSQYNVLVNTVSPGNINPDPNFLPQSSYMNRSGHPAECAAAICFLASNEASFISGVDYPVDGCRKKL